MNQKRLSIALAGNPNSGKTTIFNNITGTRQKVGNWPGVTVEKKEGHVSKFGYDVKIIDLPGTYSLTAYSLDEVVAAIAIDRGCAVLHHDRDFDRIAACTGLVVAG